jgi:O-antigen/teichoic acid export membrane protein
LRALRILTLIVFPLSILFIPLGRPIAETLLGEEWSGAGPIMMALAGVGVALSLSSVSAEAFKATARTDLLPRLHALTATVPLAFMFVLFPAGAVGMGLAMSLGLLIEATYAVRALGRISQIPLSTIFQQIRSPLIASLIMMTTLFTLDRYAIHASTTSGVEGLGRLGLDLVAAVLIYVVALTLLSRQSLMEFKEVARHLARRPRRSAPTTGAHEAAE